VGIKAVALGEWGEECWLWRRCLQSGTCLWTFAEQNDSALFSWQQRHQQLTWLKPKNAVLIELSLNEMQS